MAQQPQQPYPAVGFLRLKQILGDKKANPPIPPLIPISKSAWYKGILTGKYPKPLMLGTRTAVYSSESIRALIDRVANDAGDAA